MKKILAVLAVLFGILLEVAALSGTLGWVDVHGDLNYISGAIFIGMGVFLWNA